ncbi:MAG: AraC family transcriptional regulator [Cyanobacteria bacterium P01_F01_bin.56]
MTEQVISPVIHQATVANQCQELASLLTQHTDSKGDGFHQTAIDQMVLQRASSVPTAIHSVCNPFFAVLVQGKKKVLLGEEVYACGVAQYLVASVDLPLGSFVVEATSEKPYLGLKVNIDPTQLCDLAIQTSSIKRQQENAVRGFFVSTIDQPLLDCTLRLTKLLDTPQDIVILAPLMIRELYYRLLMSDQGAAVRQIATSSSNMQRIAEVIEHLKADLARPMQVENLAKRAEMSASSFHHHFKAVTSMSPLQYQKQLRLLEARRLMLAENSSASNAAYQVGYESPSQFSREYSRMFGAPPIRDIERLRTA